MDLHRRIVLPVCRGPCFHRLRRPRPRPPRYLLPLPWRRPPPRPRRRAPRRRPPPGEGGRSPSGHSPPMSSLLAPPPHPIRALSHPLPPHQPLLHRCSYSQRASEFQLVLAASQHRHEVIAMYCCCVIEPAAVLQHRSRFVHGDFRN
ncbi:hypothetical protein PVAP13_8NG211908 [Panicum virgatum]|uniref:Uncharacterized protein n=1 Tax=Panicum virgatum TaxID=38727 RepID=A0A8T0P414_PANVG|nr:hypothetical protein PVAP13_8NG211908 [Panicum virgatum]